MRNRIGLAASSYSPIFFLIIIVALLQACSSAEKKFERITPGMTQEGVRDAMDGGPSRFEQVSGTDYSTWYWGGEYCVLFKGDRVVAKDSTREGTSANVGPGSYEEKTQAQCLAPGQSAKSGPERTINIPGIGKVRLPESRLRNPATNSESPPPPPHPSPEGGAR